MDELKKIQQEQMRCCEHYKANFLGATDNQLVVVSSGVLSPSKEVEGVRYPSPSHMSGWWLTTDEYDGDVNSLQTLHFQHIREKRPDLAIYMGLPFGYRFLLGGVDEHVWYDEVAANENSYMQ